MFTEKILTLAIVALITLTMAGCANVSLAAADDHAASSTHQPDIETLAYTAANRYIDRLDQLRGMETEDFGLFRHPDVYEFSSRLDALNNMQADKVSNADDFITHLDRLRNLGQ